MFEKIVMLLMSVTLILIALAQGKLCERIDELTYSLGPVREKALGCYKKYENLVEKYETMCGRALNAERLAEKYRQESLDLSRKALSLENEIIELGRKHLKEKGEDDGSSS